MGATQTKNQNRQDYMKQYRQDHKEAHREYCRQWRASHPEKVAEYNARYWAKRAAQKKADQDQADPSTVK